jgi:hypothetical protein
MRKPLPSGGAAGVASSIVEAIVALAVLAFAGYELRDDSVPRQIAAAALVAVLIVVRIRAAFVTRSARARVTASLAADEADAAERATIAAERARMLRARAATATDAVNAAIVEIVAAEQAVVRQAHPDDVLMRMRGAEDGAYAALDDIRRIADDEDDEVAPDLVSAAA